MKLNEIIDGFNGNVGEYRLSKVYILSPYISDHFFEQLNEFNPENILIVTDAGISKEAIKKVQKLINARLEMKFAQCSGIVHAKAYLFQWFNDKEGMKTLFLWGSCNASDGGFGRNAEIYSWMTEIPSELVDYFKSLETEYHIKSAQILVNNDIIISLPALDFINLETESTFDLWLQKGFLCHSFPNDTRFRHFKLQLLNGLGRNDEITKLFMQNGIPPIQQTTISYDYLRYGIENRRGNEFNDDDNYSKQWKSNFFIDTLYGYWTSFECYYEKEVVFRRPDMYRRQREIDEIQDIPEKRRYELIQNFIAILDRICRNIDNVEKYFSCNEEGYINKAYYQHIFMEQLKKDIVRSRDKWFSECYIKGFEFDDVPPLKNFSKHWNSFVLSFCNTLFSNIKLNKRNKLSRTLGSIEEFDEVIDDIDNGKYLLEDWLRENWKKHESTIRGFYLR